MKITAKEVFLWPLPPCEPNLKIPESRGTSRWNSTEYNILFSAEVQKGLLAITLYRPSGEWIARIFASQTDFVTQLAESENPSRSMLYNLKQHYGSRLHGTYYGVGDANVVILDFLSPVLSGKQINCGIRALELHQKKIRSDQLDKKHQVIRDRIKQRMKGITEELPAAFKTWVLRYPMKDSRYLTYEYQANSKEVVAYCSHCKHDVTVKEPRHLQKGFCPRCKSPATQIASGRRTYSNDNCECWVFYFQRIGNQYVIRQFDVRMKHTHEGAHSTATLGLTEVTRQIMTADHEPVFAFIKDNFKQTGFYEWCEMGAGDYPKGLVYPGNLNTVARVDPSLDYIPVQAMVKNRGFRPTELFSHLKILEKAKYLRKIGLERMAGYIKDDPDSFNKYFCEASTPWGTLGIERQELHRIVEGNISCSALECYHLIKKQYGKVSDHNFEVIRTTEWLKRTTTRSMSSFFELETKHPFHRVIKYLAGQSEGVENDVSLGDWCDYYTECQELDYDLTDTAIVFPHKFTESHTRTSGLVEIQADEENNEKIIQRAMELNDRFYYENNDLIIRAPKDLGEIIYEGKILKHCVGGYAKRHAKSETTLLFIRKKRRPNAPFFTMEYQNGKLVQCRTKGNKNYKGNPEIEKFIDEWLEYISNPKVHKKPMTA